MALYGEANKSFEDESAYAEFAKQKSHDNLSLYEAESQALALYDQLVELRLEKAILEARQEISSVDDSLDAETESRLKAAETDCLEARAAYLLKSSIVESIIITDPVLKAIHSGSNAIPPERLLHPLIDRRDVLGMAQTNLSAELHSTFKALTMTEAQNIEAMEKNRKLTTTLMELTNQMRAQQVSTINESQLSDQLEKVRDDTRTARRRCKIMKSLVAAVIVGSGIDWARNDELRSVVIDEEE